jgi:diguanylate cyclase (GGDEF)-like protein
MKGVVILTRDLSIAYAARETCLALELPVAIAATLGELAKAAQTIDWSELVIDQRHPAAGDAVARLGPLVAGRRVIGVAREMPTAALAGVHLFVLVPVLGRALEDLASSRSGRFASSHDRLLAASVLGNPLDDAIDAAAHEIAVVFNVTRCIISERPEPVGTIMTDGATFDAQAWSLTTHRCRAAVAVETTLVVPSPTESTACDSYLAVPLDIPRGGTGFVALLASGARPFSADERATLRAIAARISRELRWRTVHDTTAEELDRALAAPGLDPLLGIWNRAGLDQLAHHYASSAKRYKIPLTVLALRVVDLEGVNTRHGMAMGDRLLRRIADALKPALRAEDIVGRYSGTVLAVLLQGTSSDDAKRVAERVRAMLDERSLEVPGGEPVKIGTTIGISVMRDDEVASQLLLRTVRATKDVPDNVIALVSAATTASGRIARSSDAPDLQLRTSLGGSYRLRHEISRGGMGVVYRADDLALERPVAIKMLRPELAQNAELVKHLRREAALLARVHHRNLVQIYNFGQTEGDCYFVMELVDGESLQSAIDRHRAEDGQMPLLELLGVIEQIASALDALHEKGIVHRDVKPANFIRDPFTGRCVLVDVGIAHRFGELSKQAGTPGFMAPEVIQGIAASPRSDVYGLAASVFAMATCALPWGDGEPIEIIMRQCNEAPPKASSLRADLEPVDNLLAEALSFDVERRPASAGALARSLSRALGMIQPRSSPRAQQGKARSEVGSGTAPRTRGVVFRAIPRVLGVLEADRMRDAISDEHAELAQTLAQCAPLGWFPSELLVQLLALAPKHLAREPAQFAREIAHATVRTSFRSFFPASPQTLHPDRTISAIRGIWSRYHTWGNVSAIPVSTNEAVVRITDTLRVRAMCEWTCELLETLVVVSGGTTPKTVHDTCELDGAEACAFRVTWLE